MISRRLFRSRLVFSALLFAVALASLLVVDTVNPHTDSVQRGLAGVDPTKKSRVLVLLVDGFRYETATSSQLMPQLARLRATGASGQIETVFEGFTIPAVRAALSGKAETQLVNAIHNFHFTVLPIESVFLDASRNGKTSLVIGDEPFTQFGPYYEKRLPPAQIANMYARDRVRPAMALAAYATETQDLIICHYESGDWAGHEFGIDSPKYAAEYAATDSVIARFAAARRPTDYLFVFGDHGHNAVGEHKTGLHIPTFGLFVGPDITPGVVFQPLQISNIRLLLSHALGITLHTSPYQVKEIARFLPLATSADHEVASAQAAVSQRPQDYALFALFLVLGALCLVVAIQEVPAFHTSAVGLGVSLVFVAELIAQRAFDASWSAFPFLLLIVAATMLKPSRRAGVVVAAIGLFFISRFAPGAPDGSLLRIPSVTALVPLYAAGVAAKLFLLLSIAGKRRWWQAAALTLVLSLLEFRVLDFSAIYVASVALALAGVWYWRAEAHRRLLLSVFGYAVVYFTLRLPLYEYAWIDLFFAAVLLARRYGDARWTDALVISGTFTLTSVWLSGGIEWGFLYGFLPAYVVELQVIWFLPLILLKIPMLLVLGAWLTDARPSRGFVIAMLAYTGLRFAAVWIVRLAGGSGAEMWPLAEQGMYLVTFAIAAVWMYRTAGNHGAVISRA